MEKIKLEDLIKFSKTVRVLYVENDFNLREDSFRVFKVFFHHIDTASDGIEGFNLFKKNKYDLIITSVDMPNMSGVEMITKIRDISRHITILIKSSDTKNFIDLIRLGIDGYILKPVEIEQFTIIIQKVIEKLQNKQELYEYKNSLEQKVKDKTKELELLNSNLEEKVQEEILKNKNKDKLLTEQSKIASMVELIGNIGHQWRQPLSVISTGITGMKMQKELNTLTDEEFFETCDVINNNTQYLSKVIHDFRGFIKSDRTKTIFKLEDEVKSFLTLVEGSIKTHNIIIVLDLQKDIKIDGYENELTQCLVNIFDNAKDVFKELKNKNRYIFILSSLEDKNIVIKIKDNGGGISEDIIDKVFEPYFTTKHQSQGTGLGLHMTYNLIVQGMGGNIEVKNSDYKYKGNSYTGAEFTITLPLS